MPVKITNLQPSGPLYRLGDVVTRETVSDLSVVLFPAGRFFSFTVTVDLPVEGLLTSSCGSPVQPRR
jgi:hypothetical protein